MIIKQTNLFSKQKKKLNKNEIADLDQAVKTIATKPELGETKKGDLSHIKVYKFKILSREYLLAYSHTDTLTILYAVGTHENFYRDIKRVLKTV